MCGSLSTDACPARGHQLHREAGTVVGMITELFHEESGSLSSDHVTIDERSIVWRMMFRTSWDLLTGRDLRSGTV
jgi:hypothetical protein